MHVVTDLVEPASPPEGHLIPEHPAAFPKVILDLLGRLLVAEYQLRGPIRVLDPFAGAGGVHKLAQEGVETYGVEIQKEWAVAHPNTICGSVLELPSIFPAATFDVICTSPSFGSRMADSHDAKDACRSCDGKGITGQVPDPEAGHEGGVMLDVLCKTCRGSGLSRRNTYTHALARSGVEIVRSDDNSALMQFGPAYREFHERAWRACDRVLRPGGLVLLDVKNFVKTRKKGEPAEVVRVVEFHLNAWLMLGYTLEEAKRVPTRGLAYGSNHEARVPAEIVLVLRKVAA